MLRGAHLGTPATLLYTDTLLPEVINFQSVHGQIGEMQHSDLRSRFQKHRGSLAPSREVEDTGHWEQNDQLCGKLGVCYKVVKAPSAS